MVVESTAKGSGLLCLFPLSPSCHLSQHSPFFSSHLIFPFLYMQSPCPLPMALWYSSPVHSHPSASRLVLTSLFCLFLVNSIFLLGSDHKPISLSGHLCIPSWCSSGPHAPSPQITLPSLLHFLRQHPPEFSRLAPTNPHPPVPQPRAHLPRRPPPAPKSDPSLLPLLGACGEGGSAGN